MAEEITEKWLREHIKVIKVGKIRPNTWNFMGWEEEEFLKFKQSIERRGFKGVLLGRKIKNEKYDYEVEDGEHRLTALIELGYKTVPVFITEDSDVDARTATIDFNLRRGEPDSIKLAELFKELHKKYSLTLEEMEEKTGFSAVEIQGYIDLLDFDFDEPLDLGNGDDVPMSDLVPDEVVVCFTVSGEMQRRLDDVLNFIRQEKKFTTRTAGWKDIAFTELIKEKEKKITGGE